MNLDMTWIVEFKNMIITIDSIKLLTNFLTIIN